MKPPSNTNKQCYMNYTGSKRQFLSEIETITSEFKDDHLKVGDLFTGGSSLGTSLPVNWEITCNDSEQRLIQIHKYFQSAGAGRFNSLRDEILRNVSSKTDVEGFETTKKRYNSAKVKDHLDLYTLITSSNTNRARWNSSGEFNVQFGKRYFNTNMQTNLENWMQRVNERDITFTSKDYKQFEIGCFDLEILDPPYSYDAKSDACYSENGKWGLRDMMAVMSRCEQLHKQGKKFILFNESVTKGVDNIYMQSFMKNYKYKEFGDTLNNSSANRTSDKSVEVMIWNF